MCRPNPNEAQLQAQRQREVTVHLEEEQNHLQTPRVPLNLANIPVALSPEQERRERERRENERVAALFQQQLAPVWADAAAPGVPVQELAPPKRSVKQRVKDHFHGKEARKHCPPGYGDAVTYDMVHGLQEMRTQKNNSLALCQGMVVESGINLRMLTAFTEGFRTNKKDDPKTPEDVRRRDRDVRFLTDYCSGDLERRRPHLQRIVDEMVSFRFDLGMLSAAYLREHPAEMKQLADRCVFFDQIRNDPINEPFFQELRERNSYKADMLESRNADGNLFALITATVNTHFQANAVQVANERYDYITEPVHIDETRENVPELDRRLGGAMLRDKDAQAKAHRDHRFQQCDWRKRRIDVRGNPPAADSPLIVKSRTLMRSGRAHEEENQRLMTAMKALSQSVEDPGREVYLNALEALRPLVQRVMDCDVDKLIRMSDEELVEESDSLLEIVDGLDSLKEIMAIPRYKIAGNSDKLTLGSDLVMSQDWKFDYQASVLRALSKKAFTLVQQEVWRISHARADDLGVEILDLEDEADSMEEIQANLRESDLAIQAAREELQKSYQPGSEQCTQMIMRLSQHSAMAYPSDPKFDAVTEEFNLHRDQEWRCVYQRLQQQHYFSLEYTDAQLAEMKKKRKINEPLFRSLRSFQLMQSTQAMTPEEYRTMLLDLGAGMIEKTVPELDKNGQPTGKMVYDYERVQPGSPEEEEAIARNRQGMATLKRALTQQYDMLSRKYGTAIESSSLETFVEHWDDISIDFANTQVSTNLADNFPGFFDLENSPEDRLLYHRIQYFNYCAGIALSVPAHLVAGQSTEDARQSLRSVIAGFTSKFQDHRPYLQENDPNLSQGFDWNQRVQ